MTPFVVAIDDVDVKIDNNALATYQFDSKIAKHHFCKICGIYPFHETIRAPGHYRFNIGCLENVDPFELPVSVFDGASL